MMTPWYRWARRYRDVVDGTETEADKWIYNMGVEAYYVYRMFDDNGTPLYYGQTDSLRRRLKQHHDEQEWIGEVARIDVSESYPTRRAAYRAEQQAIEEDGPKYNQLGKRSTQRGMTRAQAGTGHRRRWRKRYSP
jgi:predicted GIY-YIG superfamily endonuclease